GSQRRARDICHSVKVEKGRTGRESEGVNVGCRNKDGQERGIDIGTRYEDDDDESHSCIVMNYSVQWGIEGICYGKK
ncbi:hypothetical protein PILCRDRAFT_826772, partial [Piloderma croceum F 1598]